MREATRAGSVQLDVSDTYEPVAGGTGLTSCYDGALVRYTEGGHTITVVGTADFMTNSGLLQEGNAALAMNLAGARQRVIWYTPTAHRRRIWWFLVDHGPHPRSRRLDRAAVVSGRRLRRAVAGTQIGPLVAEDIPVVVRASETVEGRGRLYRSRRARDRAAAALRTAVLQRMLPRLGLGAQSDPASVVDRRARTGHATSGHRARAVRTTPLRRRRTRQPLPATRRHRKAGRQLVTHPTDFDSRPRRRAKRVAGVAFRDRQGRRRAGRRGEWPGDRAAVPRPRAAGGRTRRRQDAVGPHLVRGAATRLQARAVHPGPDARRRHGIPGVRRPHGRVRVPGRPGVHQPASGRRDQPNATEDPGRAARGHGGASGQRRRGRRDRSPTRSSSPRPRTRSSTRAPTSCPKPSWTASCSSSTCRCRRAIRRSRSSPGTPAASTRGTSPAIKPVAGPAELAAGREAVRRVLVADEVMGYIVDIAGATRQFPGTAAGRLTTRRDGTARHGEVVGLAVGAQLRRARRRQGDGAADAAAPDRAATRGRTRGSHARRRPRRHPGRGAGAALVVLTGRVGLVALVCVLPIGVSPWPATTFVVLLVSCSWRSRPTSRWRRTPGGCGSAGSATVPRGWVSPSRRAGRREPRASRDSRPGP